MIFIATMLFSCRNDLKTIEALGVSDTIPELIVKDVVMYRSDSGILKAKLTSKLVYQYGGNEPCIVFPEGFFVTFYDDEMNEESTLVAGYGKNFERQKLLVAQKNVIVRNLKKDEQLNTEELSWDQRKHKIFSNVKVKVITLSEVIYGTGLVSDEKFDRYEIMNPKGTVEVEEDELEDEKVKK